MSLQTRLEALVAAIGADIKERVTLSSAQVITGVKTYPPGTLLMRNAGATVVAEPYSDVNPPADLDQTVSAVAPASPPAGLIRQYAIGSRPFFIDETGASGRMDNTLLLPFTRPGNLAVVAGTARIPIPYACRIESVSANLTTAPTGATAIVDVNKNGTTIFGTAANRPTFAIGSNTATVGANSVVTTAAGDYLTIDIDQIGSTVAGADLVVAISLRRL